MSHFDSSIELMQPIYYIKSRTQFFDNLEQGKLLLFEIPLNRAPNIAEVI